MKVYANMGTNGRLLGVIGVGLCLLGGAKGADVEKLSSGNNAFAFSLAKELAKEKPGENIFISPYSISTALQMVRAGAGGETRAEMDRVLGVAGTSGNGLA